MKEVVELAFPLVAGDLELGLWVEIGSGVQANHHRSLEDYGNNNSRIKEMGGEIGCRHRRIYLPLKLSVEGKEKTQCRELGARKIKLLKEFV